jgi:tetratricopeptide (TPR) repeat protein
MTVRWKPLMFLSGLFLVVALIGVVAITLTLLPRSPQGIVQLARAARQAGRFENAEIHYKRALQLEAKNAAIHEEFAGLYREWARHAPADKQAGLHTEWVGHLVSAAKIDKALKGPRKQLLEDAMSQDLGPDSLIWGRELLSVEPDNADAHYILAAEALEERTPNVPEVRRHLEVLDKKETSPARRIWIHGKLADVTGDITTRQKALDEARTLAIPTDADSVDRIAQLRLTALAIRAETRSADLAGHVEALRQQLKALGKPEELAPPRVARLQLLLEQTQRALTERSASLPPEGKKDVDRLVQAIEVDLDSVFQQALAGGRQPDLQTYLSYAVHLRFRRQPDRCLEVIDRALQSAQAARRPAVQTVMGLHAVAVEMLLTRNEDKERFNKADPHIQALLDCPETRLQAFGHLFAGSIDLDRSGLTREIGTTDLPGGAVRPTVPRLRSSALNHLKIAAAALPDVAEAQARYGVALVLCQEQNLGRQYLQTALRLGSLDPQYQLWAAWTILQAGYPEEAEPIVESLLKQVALGAVPRELEGTLHLLRGELHQARRSPDDLKKAGAEFDKALAAGQSATPMVVMRQAQIDMQLGHHAQAWARLEPLRAHGQGGAAAEQLAVLALEEQGKKAEARSLARAARAKYPKSSELAGLEAALLVRDGKPNEADRALEVFLREEPENTSLVMMRAQIQAESLKDAAKARELLRGIAETSDSSAPLVQLAGLEIDQNRLDDAAAVVAKIRERWKEAAAADVLDAQIALRRGKVTDAADHFDTALKKDPENKIVQFWKAQLDARTGSVEEATRALEAIVRDRPVKEVDPGTTLLSAAQSALANLSLQTNDVDAAIRRFEELKRGGQAGTLTRPDRWQLISAYIAKGQWPVARREIAAILNDTEHPPTLEERVRGANFYRQQGEDAAALSQLDYVLKVEPTNPSAVVSRAFVMLRAKEYVQAAALLRKSIELTKDDKKGKSPIVFFVMLAAVENETPPSATALERALQTLDAGLQQYPLAYELVQARYLALAATGDLKGALASVEAKAKEDPKGPFRRLLVEKCREQGEYSRAFELLTELHQEFPDDANLAAALVQVVSLEAAQAALRKQPERQRELDDRAATMIAEYRARYSKDLSFLQVECDIAARQGDYTRAIAITHEIDEIAKSSTLGPLLRARLFTRLGKPRERARAYTEAIERERGPARLDLRVLLGQTQLALGEADEALRQAKLVLDVEKNRPDAVLLATRAMADSGSTTSEKAAQRERAAAQLKEVIKANPSFSQAYHVLADVHLKRQDRSAAAGVLRECLRANPTDTAAVEQVVMLLSARGPAGQPPRADDLATARSIATEIAQRDAKGPLILALAVGFHKAGQLELALPYAQDAAAKLETPGAHLVLGDVLLTIAESRSDRATARETFDRAVAEYDRVLKVHPSSIEAVNNKAWILNAYLEQSPKALELVLDLQKRVSRTALPGEFFDTLGSIHESLGQAREAELAYLEGLNKSPENPVLSFHFGKLIAADPSRAAQAKAYLEKALAFRERMSPSMTQEAERLIREINRSLASAP